MSQLRIFDIQDGEKFQESMPVIYAILLASILISALVGYYLKPRDKK
jgi:hypothetical protein